MGDIPQSHPRRSSLLARQKLVDAAADAGVDRVVYASTSGTIACSRDRNRVATELDPFPREVVKRWPYYVSKIAAEEVALKRSRERGVSAFRRGPRGSVFEDRGPVYLHHLGGGHCLGSAVHGGREVGGREAA